VSNQSSHVSGTKPYMLFYNDSSVLRHVAAWPSPKFTRRRPCVNGILIEDSIEFYTPTCVTWTLPTDNLLMSIYWTDFFRLWRCCACLLIIWGRYMYTSLPMNFPLPIHGHGRMPVRKQSKQVVHTLTTWHCYSAGLGWAGLVI
jgi:hypothetical protein